MAPEIPSNNIRDGFRFGLGFTVAGCLVSLAFFVVLLVLVLALT